jgi:hypothetical protein
LNGHNGVLTGSPYEYGGARRPLRGEIWAKSITLEFLMSFDLGVWNSDPLGAERRATAIYETLCRGAHCADLVASPNVTQFYGDLMAMWPEHEAIKVNHSDRHVLISCEWSKAQEVYVFVRELAKTHNLVFFDPQSDEVVVPE